MNRGGKMREKKRAFWLICLRLSGWLFFLCAVVIGLAAGIPVMARQAWSGWLMICMGASIGFLGLSVVRVLLGIEEDIEKNRCNEKKR